MNIKEHGGIDQASIANNVDSTDSGDDSTEDTFFYALFPSL